MEKVCSARQAHLVRIPDSHTADNIVDELKGVLSDWSLSQQGIAATTDNGANIKSAIGMFDCPHFPCFSHTLQLAVEQALKTSRGCKDDWKTQTTNGTLQLFLQVKLLVMPEAACTSSQAAFPPPGCHNSLELRVLHG